VSVRGRVGCTIACGPSGGGASLRGVLIAELICSDEDCAAEVDLVAEDAGALDAATALACDCGCTLVVLAVSEWTRAEARVRVPAFA
jgi:hypothetical protein